MIQSTKVFSETQYKKELEYVKQYHVWLAKQTNAPIKELLDVLRTVNTALPEDIHQEYTIISQDL